MTGNPVPSTPPLTAEPDTTLAAHDAREGASQRRESVVRRVMAARMWREVLLLIAGYTLYSFVRNAAPDRKGLAVAHAHDVIALQERLGLNVEPSINHYFDEHVPLAVFANYFYAIGFSLTTIVTLVVLWRIDWRVFRFHRTVLVVMTGAAMVTYWLYPLAPPRLVPDGGFVDTFIKYRTWGRLHTPANEDVSNQYAAMPSMHTGWSIWVAVSVCFVAGRWWIRVLACSLPVVTVVVIMATANHFVLDAAAGASYYALAFTAVLIATRRRRERAASRLRPTAPPAADSRRSDAPDCPPTRSPNSPA